MALVLGTAANVFLPQRIPWRENWADRVEAKAIGENLPTISAEQARRLLRQGQHVFLDARAAVDYAEAHIPAALSLPFDRFVEAFPEVQPALSPELSIVAYCSGKECDESLLLALLLRQMGFPRVVLFVGGMDQWREAGYPVERGGP
jgi:rhodanese-related sulfurtransferase